MLHHIYSVLISAVLLLAVVPNALLALTESTSSTPPLLIPEEFNAPLNESPDRFVSEFLNMLAMLGLVLLVLLAVTWFLKKVLNSRLQQVDASSSLKILERRPISPKSTLLLVEVAGKGMALAESTNGITFLSLVPLEGIEEDMEEPSVAPKPAKGFSSFLEAPPK